MNLHIPDNSTGCEHACAYCDIITMAKKGHPLLYFLLVQYVLFVYIQIPNHSVRLGPKSSAAIGCLNVLCPSDDGQQARNDVAMQDYIHIFGILIM